MKVLVVTQYFWPEQFRINDLCSELLARGHDVTVLTGLPNYPEGKFFEGYSLLGPYQEQKNQVRIIRVPMLSRGKSKGIRLALNFFSFALSASVLSPFLVRGKFDQIFVLLNSPVTAAIPAIVLKFFKRAPVTVWVQDLWPDTLLATGIVKNKKILKLVGLMVKAIYHFSDKILVTSRGFVSRIEALGVPSEKIQYWPQWAEELFADKVSSNFGEHQDTGFPVGGFIIMFAGNIGSSQDFETIVEAATILKDDELQIKFVILGDGNMKKWAEEQVIKRGLTGSFYLLGRKPLETMPYYFSQADVMLVSLSDSELFSITVPAKLQAYLASGKPILGSLNGEGAKIIEEWECGKSSPAGRPELLAQTIKSFAGMDQKEIKKMGENSLKCYYSEFQREKLIDKLERILTESSM